MDKRKRIVILFSDTGGGHRSGAEAIAAGIDYNFPGKYEIVILDGIKYASIFPFNHMPEWYLPFTTYAGLLWGALFHSTNNQIAAQLVNVLGYLIMGKGLKRLFTEYPPDLVVTVHSLLNTVPRQVLRELGIAAPFVVSIGDLFNAHCLWYDSEVDLCFVPTEEAYTRGLKLGMPKDRLCYIGLPISLKFLRNPSGYQQTKQELRNRLGLDANLPALLLVGGGEGMGHLFEIAHAISNAQLPVQLVIIAGRNKPLYNKLSQVNWKIPVLVQGFVSNMPDWMLASELIITKAGPATIIESIGCGLPILLSGFLRGQEEGNVTFVLENNLGILCQDPNQIVKMLTELLSPGDGRLEKFAKQAAVLARPQAALEIAKVLDHLANVNNNQKMSKEKARPQ